MGEATGPVSDTRSDERHQSISRRTDGTGHWLFFDKYRRVAGCSCGFPADIENDAGYGDSVIDHIADVAAAEATTDLRRRLDEANRRIEAAHVALRYIASPTMGLPSGVDPEQFAREGATDSSVRLALQACIRTARAALSDPTEGDTQ